MAVHSDRGRGFERSKLPICHGLFGRRKQLGQLKPIKTWHKLPQIHAGLDYTLYDMIWHCFIMSSTLYHGSFLDTKSLNHLESDMISGNGQFKWKVPQVWLSHWQSLAHSGIPLCTLLAPYFRSNQDLQNKNFEKKNIWKVSWNLHCDPLTPYEGNQISWHHLTISNLRVLGVLTQCKGVGLQHDDPDLERSKCAHLV